MYVFQINTDNLPYEKVGKNEPVCIADEVPFDIPDSWEWVTLKMIAVTGLGKTLDKAKNQGDYKPYLCSINVYWSGIDLTTVKEARFEESELPKYELKKGDLLICEGGDVGRSAIWENEQEMYYQNALHRVRFYGGVNPHYFRLLMECYKGNKILDEQSKGMTIKHLVQSALNAIYFPLPPIQEQQRIVDKFQSLIPMLEEYNASEIKMSNLNTGFPNLLKKSILHEAVQGKLVPQDPADEPASVLLERIRAEKEQLIKAGKIKRDKHESVIFRRDNSHYEKSDGIERCIDNEIPFEIPENWCWTRLGTMIGVQRGASPRPKGSPEYWSSERTPHHWIKISDITKYTQNDALYDTDEFLTDLGSTKSVFVDSDYLITAASGSLGKIAKLNISGYIYDGLMCMCFKNTSLEMDYIIILIQAMVEYLMSLSTGTAWKNITTDILKNLLVPLPPLSEQRRIVEKHRELLDKITLI